MAEAASAVEIPSGAPAEWGQIPLGALLDESTLRARSLGAEAADVPVLSITRHGGLVLQSKKFGKRIAGRDISAYKLVKRGQIVCGFPLDEGVIYTLEDQALGVVSPVYMVWDVASDLADPGFLSQLLRTPSMCRLYMDLASRTVHRRRIVKKSDFLGIEIALPSLAEQRRIGRVLSTVQKAIVEQNKVIAAAREVKRSLMHHLFTYGPVPVSEAARVPLRESEVGRIPNHWRIVELSSVANIVYGAQAAVAHLLDPENGTPILTNLNITDEGRIDLSTIRYYPVPEKRRDRLILRPGDVLFNWRSGSQEHVGKSALFDLDGEYTFSSFILRFRCNGPLTPNYLYWCLQYLRRTGFFRRRRDQSSVNSVFNASAAARIPIPEPPAPEEAAIGNLLQASDRKLIAELVRRQVLLHLFNSLLHHLMTGKIRVPETLEV